MIAKDRSGTPVKTYDGEGRSIAFLYGTAFGRLLLKMLVRPWVSKTAGWILSRRISALFIGPFVRKNGVDLSDYEGAPYKSYNAFFIRRIRPDRRPVTDDPCALAAPCDAKLTALPIGADSSFRVKGTTYTMEELLQDETLGGRYLGGTFLLFRLTVDDYHRYAFPADGTLGAERHISSVFHTVNPRAAAACPIYRENTREYAVLQTDAFGPVLIMEVGAMMVGKIENRCFDRPVRRGEEKGNFAFGGSTVILCIEKNRLVLDEDIRRNSAQGVETIVKLGEKIGTTANV